MKKYKVLGILLIILAIICDLSIFIVPLIGMASDSMGGFAISGFATVLLFGLSTPVFIAGVIVLIVGAAKSNNNANGESSSGFSFFKKNKCKYCGSEIPYGETVCSSCGAKSNN